MSCVSFINEKNRKFLSILKSNSIHWFWWGKICPWPLLSRKRILQHPSSVIPSGWQPQQNFHQKLKWDCEKSRRWWNCMYFVVFISIFTAKSAWENHLSWTPKKNHWEGPTWVKFLLDHLLNWSHVPGVIFIGIKIILCERIQRWIYSKRYMEHAYNEWFNYSNFCRIFQFRALLLWWFGTWEAELYCDLILPEQYLLRISTNIEHIDVSK